MLSELLHLSSISIWLLALAGCATTTSGGAVGANRSQLLLVSSEQLEQTAALGYTKLKSEATQNGALNKDEKLRNVYRRSLAESNLKQWYSGSMRRLGNGKSM